jgi:hypothetical protein
MAALNAADNSSRLAGDRFVSSSGTAVASPTPRMDASRWLVKTISCLTSTRNKPSGSDSASRRNRFSRRRTSSCAAISSEMSLSSHTDTRLSGSASPTYLFSISTHSQLPSRCLCRTRTRVAWRQALISSHWPIARWWSSGWTKSSDRCPSMSAGVQPSIRSIRSSTWVITAYRFLCTVAVRGRVGTSSETSRAGPSAADVHRSSAFRNPSHTPNRCLTSTTVNETARSGSLDKRTSPWANPTSWARSQISTTAIRSAGTTKSTTVSRSMGSPATRSSRGSSGSRTRTAASVSASATEPLRDNKTSTTRSSAALSRYVPLGLTEPPPSPAYPATTCPDFRQPPHPVTVQTVAPGRRGMRAASPIQMGKRTTLPLRSVVRQSPSVPNTQQS